MDPYFLQELSRIRRQEIDDEFKRIHLFRSMKASQPNLISRVLKRFCGLPAEAGKVFKIYGRIVALKLWPFQSRQDNWKKRGKRIGYPRITNNSDRTSVVKILKKGSVLRVKGNRSGQSIRCLNGTIWLTQQGDDADKVINTGETYLSNLRSFILVEALNDSLINISPEVMLSQKNVFLKSDTEFWLIPETSLAVERDRYPTPQIAARLTRFQRNIKKFTQRTTHL